MSNPIQPPTLTQLPVEPLPQFQQQLQPLQQAKPMAHAVAVATPHHKQTSESSILSGRHVVLCALLNHRLAEAIDLHLQMKQAHWNVKGPHFIGLHQLFDQIAAVAVATVDVLAERIMQLDGMAEGTIGVVSGRSRLAAYPLTIADGSAHIAAVAMALNNFRSQLDSAISQAVELEDPVTADVITDIARSIDKWRWFVTAHAAASSTAPSTALSSAQRTANA